jgi:hypothetical protein
MICRRDAFLVGPAAAVAAIATALPRASQAASTETNGITSVPELLSRIRVVPTFCIVDPNGAAYMLVKQDERMAKGYAFTTFSGAKIVLEDAQKTATEKGYGEVWQDATITTIPADAAIRLSLTKKERFSQKDQSLDSILSIIPSAVSCQERLVDVDVCDMSCSQSACSHRKTEPTVYSWTRTSLKTKERFHSFTLINWMMIEHCCILINPNY